MARKLHVGCLILLAWISIVSEVSSTQRGTAEEAQALVARAIAAYKAQGEDAFERISAPSTEFRDRDLYVFVVGPDHKTVAHGGDANQVGVDVTKARDPDGRAFGQEFIEQANGAGSWVEYKFQDAQSGEVLPKSSWIVLYDGYIFGAGIYKDPSD